MNYLHSATAPNACADVQIVEYNSDNYGYIVTDPQSGDFFLVDAADPSRFTSLIDKIGTPKLKAILTTHHHHDHSDGNAALHKKYPEVPIYGSAYEQTPGATHNLTDGQTLNVGSLTITAIHVPAHTMGHIAYLVKSDNDSAAPLIFTGDFLFLSGCGRFFEGTAQNMQESILKLYQQVPQQAFVFPGHEYSESNLKFAKHVDPQNNAVDTKLAQVQERRAQQSPAIPSTLAEELSYNPFVRAVQSPEKMPNYSGDAVKFLAELRAQKDKF